MGLRSVTDRRPDVGSPKPTIGREVKQRASRACEKFRQRGRDHLSHAAMRPTPSPVRSENTVRDCPTIEVHSIIVALLSMNWFPSPAITKIPHDIRSFAP